MYNRFEVLDSLRGLAALSVVLSHIFLVIPNFFITSRLNNTPIHIIWAGHEAVILFFLLSGFVLSLPYTINKPPLYKSFLIKRITRIYIPYIISILIGIIFISIIPRDGINGLTNFFSRTGMAVSIDTSTLLSHLVFLGDYKNINLNFVVWSLIHEMRISIFFPLLIDFSSKT
jgi:peptidoglycan/LPS O-acetylase OafA/YrhL